MFVGIVRIKFIYFRFHYCRQSPDLLFRPASLPSFIFLQKWRQSKGKTVLVHLQMESSTVTPVSRKMSPTHVHTHAVGQTPGNYQRPFFFYFLYLVCHMQCNMRTASNDRLHIRCSSGTYKPHFAVASTYRLYTGVCCCYCVLYL